MNPIPLGWRLWVQIAGGIVAADLVIWVLHHFGVG